MDKSITVQFFKVLPKNDGVPPFEVALDACLGLGANPGDRELPISDDETVRVRLERLMEHGGWLEGEVVRVQRDNIPHEAYPDGLRPSRAESQGHSAVFRYNPALSLLVMETNATNMTPSRFTRYVRRVDGSARYELTLIPNQDVWERYGRMRPKRFSVTLASVSNAEAVEGEVGAILHSSRILHEVTNGGVIQISVRPGGEPEGLEKGAIARIIEGFLEKDDPSYEVKALSVSAEDEEDHASQIINFLDDILKERAEVDLNGLSSEESYERRMVILRDCYAQNMDYIIERHG
jgi:hypothetical protein